MLTSTTTTERNPDMTTNDSTPIVIGEYDFAGYMNIRFVRSYGLVYPLTPCCEASATGTEYGIACRSCYEEIDSAFGMAISVEEWPKYEATLA